MSFRSNDGLTVEEKKEIARIKTARNEPDTLFCGDSHYESDEVRNELLAILRGFEVVRILVGDEICPTTGRRHLQWRLRFRQNKRPRQVSKLLRNSHCEIAWCNAFNYEAKENVIIDESNEKKGARSDLQVAMDVITSHIQNGTFEYKMARDDLYRLAPGVFARDERFVLRYAADQLYYDGFRTVLWIYGPSEAGKSTMLVDLAPYAEVVRFERGFAQEYHGSQVVLFDDVRPNAYDFTSLLALMDYRTANVNVKGTYVHFNGKIIVITAIRHPQDYYWGDEPVEQVLRRINGGVYKLPEQDDECNRALSRYLDTFEEAPSGPWEPPGYVPRQTRARLR